MSLSSIQTNKDVSFKGCFKQPEIDFFLFLFQKEPFETDAAEFVSLLCFQSVLEKVKKHTA